MLLPFWIHALGKGYSNKEYEIEKIKYYYTGETRDIMILNATYPPNTYENEMGLITIQLEYHPELDDIDMSYRMASINKKYNRITNDDFKRQELKWQFEKNIITEFQYEKSLAELITDSKEKDLKINEIEFFFGLKPEYDYEVKKIDITYPNKNNKMYKMAILDLDKKFKNISDYEYEIKFNDLVYEKDTKEWQHKKNDIDLKFGKITEHAHEKCKLTIEGEPYFSVVSEKYDNGKIEFELDWNTIFIKKLKEEGMVGYTDQQMVDLYFKEICKQVAEEEEIFEYQEENFGPNIYREETDGVATYS